VLVEAESLLNDGTAAVGFSLLLALAGGDAVTPLGVAGTLAWTILGGVLAGLVVAGGMLLLARPSKDHMVEITLTTIAAYGSFLLAEHFHASGVLASLTAGLVVGNLGLVHTISPAGRGHVVAFWEYAAFLANSLVFILIGQQEAHHARDIATGLAGAAILLVLAGRVVAIYPLTALAARIPPRIGLARVGVARIGVARIEGRHAHVLFWGGLRGALGLALALALPDSVPERGKIIVLAFAVVAFSVFVQGLSMPWLLRRLGFLRQG
jgi:CPA1 family monovalent cation:H+ antiporter